MIEIERMHEAAIPEIAPLVAQFRVTLNITISNIPEISAIYFSYLKELV